MKRFFIVLLAFVFVAGFVMEVAAEDRLSLSGSMRVRAWSQENYYDYDDNASADEVAFWDQRFRVGATIKATDFVSGHLRFDFSEATWGDTNWGGSRYGNSATTPVQVDRAYLQIKQDMYTLKAGQLFQGTGFNYIVVDNNTTGINLTFNTVVAIDLMYSKLDENTSNNDDGTQDDSDFYGLQVKYATEAFTAGAFYAINKDQTDVDNSPNGFGLFGKTVLGPVNLQAELDIMGGDQTSTVEYTGTQLFVDGNMNFGSTMVGVNVMYAAAQSADGTEVQSTSLSNWNDWNPAMYLYGSFLSAEFNATNGGEVFDFTDDGAGVTGGSIYAKFVPMDALALYAQFCYLTPEDSDISKIANGGVSDLDSSTIINLSGVYTIVPNASIGLAYSTSMVEMQTDGQKDDAAQTLQMRLQITF